MRSTTRLASFFLFSLLTITALNSERALADSWLYGTTNRGGQVSELVRLDPNTGALIETIGSIGYSVNGITYDEVSGILYGSTSINDSNFNGLITIDRLTGAGTPVGADWGTPINSIEVSSSGQMYGWWGPGQNGLVSIDQTTGTFSVVGPTGLDTVRVGLSFGNDGNLYLANGLGFQNYTIDPQTGQATFVSQFQSIAHHGDINPDNGLYYGIDFSGNGPKNIVIGDITQGGFFLDSLPTVDNLHTLTFVVPEPTSAGVLVLTMLIGIRRKKTFVS